MPSKNTYDPAPQNLQIKDFSPGIVQFERGGYPLTYAPEAPLGSAATCARCIYRKDIGLVPFPNYTGLMFSLPPANTPVSPPILTGFLAAGPVVDITSVTTVQVPEFSDSIFIGFEYVNAGNRYRVVQKLDQDLVIPAVLIVYETNVGGATVLRPPSFAQTRMLWTVAPFYLGMQVVWNGESVSTSEMVVYPDPGNPSTNNLLRSPVPTNYAISSLLAHASRVVVMGDTPVAFGSVEYWLSNDTLFVTDPPETSTFFFGAEGFDIESPYGFGAWGSVSTGELVLIRSGQGAVVIYGDILAPQTAIRLPGVVGTGRIRQKGTETPIGLVYVTEYDGAYVWNGGNSSEKISNQIPDDGFVRPELLSNPVRGINAIHDALNNWVFLPHNWVYDCLTRSWWKCEDPAVKDFSVFSRASFESRHMYAMTGMPDASNNRWRLWAFDTLTLALTWEWTSNPLPVTMGELVTLLYCEIVASNPFGSPATITVTPTQPAGVTPIAGNNPQTLTFTIPANSSGVRLGQQMGYSDYNVQIAITAAGPMGEPAPTLHEINIGWAPVSRSGLV